MKNDTKKALRAKIGIVASPSPVKKRQAVNLQSNITRINKDSFSPDKKKLRIIPKKSKSSAPEKNLMDQVNEQIQQIPVDQDKMESSDINLIENYEKQLHENLSKCLKDNLGETVDEG